MEEPEAKKKVITLFGKKINVLPSPSSPILEVFDDSPPPLAPTDKSNNNTSPSLSTETPAPTDSVQVLKLRLHLMEQKVKQLTDSNEKLSAQLSSQAHQCEELKQEATNIHTKFVAEREKVMMLEKENKALMYQLGMAEQRYDPPHHAHSPYSPPPFPFPPAYSPMDEMYKGERRRSYNRYDDPLEYEREMERRSRDRDRGRSRESSRERSRGRSGDRSRERDPFVFPSDYHFPDDLKLPSPPPRTSVFNRLGESSYDIPSLPIPSPSPSPSLPSPLEDGEYIVDRDIERKDRERAAALEARLDLPLDALTKKNKQEKKQVNKANKAQKRPLCKFYAEQGVCKNRGACKFSHALPPNHKRAKIDL